MADVVAALRESFGSESVITDQEIVAGYIIDWTGRFRGEAFCVVRPVDSWQVQRAVEIAREHGVPLVTQGGNTGLVGGAIPVRKAIILSTKFLGGIEIESGTQIAKVGAGVTLGELNALAKTYGLRFAVDMASRDSATIGGMVATNAGGINVIRYGGMRRQLIGIEAVLGNGQLISRLDGLDKDNAGYDWSSILCGSEGTLGVVTKAMMKLVPLPAHKSVALLAVDDLGDAVDVMVEVKKRFRFLSAAEFMTSRGLALVQRLQGAKWPLATIPPYSLLLEVSDDSDATEELAAFLEESGVVRDAVLAADSASTGLWYWRERHTEAISRYGLVRKLDVAVPVRSIARFVNEVQEIVELERPLADVVLFGHLGDGNVHVNLLNLGSGDDQLDHEILAVVASYGGSISAEHGIGRAKVADLSLTRTSADIESMVSIKRALDPSLILNPGVLFG